MPAYLLVATTGSLAGCGMEAILPPLLEVIVLCDWLNGNLNHQSVYRHSLHKELQSEKPQLVSPVE